MAKKFAEHDGLNLHATNQQVLEQWNAEDVFHKSISEREGCPQFVFFEGPPQQTGTLAFTMCWPVPSKTLSIATRR